MSGAFKGVKRFRKNQGPWYSRFGKDRMPNVMLVQTSFQIVSRAHIILVNFIAEKNVEKPLHQSH